MEEGVEEVEQVVEEVEEVIHFAQDLPEYADWNIWLLSICKIFIGPVWGPKCSFSTFQH